MAVQDRLQTQKKLNLVEKEISQRSREIEELNNNNQKVTTEKQQALRELGDARQLLQGISIKIKEADYTKARITQDNIERAEVSTKVTQERDEAIQAFQ